MIHRIVLFLKFALVFGRLLIVPLWILIQSNLYGIERKIKLPLTVRLSKVCGFNFYYSRFEPKGLQCPGLGRGFFVSCINANFMKLQRCVVIRIATILKHNPITLLV